MTLIVKVDLYFSTSSLVRSKPATTGANNSDPTLMLGRMQGDDLTSPPPPAFLTPQKEKGGGSQLPGLAPWYL